jgi:hypothetical protein
MSKQGVLGRLLARLVSRVLRLDDLEARTLSVSAGVWKLRVGR